MVTVAILMLFGMIGLVVDIGWAYYNRRAAQVAADAAAQAGARKALDLGNAAGSFSAAVLPDDAPTVLDAAREYAGSNGFTDGGAGGRQTVQIKAGRAPYPGLENLYIIYWVQARVSTRVSSLFINSVKAGDSLDAGATAVAAVMLTPLPFAVQLLNTACNSDGTNCGTGYDDNACWA